MTSYFVQFTYPDQIHILNTPWTIEDLRRVHRYKQTHVMVLDVMIEVAIDMMEGRL